MNPIESIQQWGNLVIIALGVIAFLLACIAGILTHISHLIRDEVERRIIHGIPTLHRSGTPLDLNR